MPTIDENLAFTPASDLRALIADKQVSPLELTALYFERIDRLDSQLHAYLTLCRDEAMEAARNAEDAVMRGDALGALHGVPISIKDLELSKGIRSTSGSLPFTDRIPEEDSIVVERVKASGAIILGKTNTPEFGHRGTTENLLGEPCRNPWNTERTPGGSSGGAAAGRAATVAAPFAFLRASADCTASSRRRGVCLVMADVSPQPSQTSLASRGPLRARCRMPRYCCKRSRAGTLGMRDRCATRRPITSLHWSAT